MNEPKPRELSPDDDERFRETLRMMMPAAGALDMIAAERTRQVGKGFTLEHDDAHTDAQLILSAQLLLGTVYPPITPADLYRSWALPCASHAIEKYKADPIKLLTIAAAMIVAEIDRRLRAQAKPA